MILFALVAAVQAAPQSAEPDPIVVEGDKPKYREVCRTVSLSGSRVPRRVCKLGDAVHSIPGVADNIGTRANPRAKNTSDGDEKPEI